MGTESLRPSASETINSSSVTSSPTASGSFGFSKVLIPFLQVSSYVVTHNAVNLVQFVMSLHISVTSMCRSHATSVSNALSYGTQLAAEPFPYLGIIQLMANPNDNL